MSAIKLDLSEANNEYIPPLSILIPVEDIISDHERSLGRANGNVYHRLPGVEGKHDGQIMVRLKKKRFVVLDYGYAPTDADAEMIVSNPHVSIPQGAGRTKCVAKECDKIGVPVCLYDSEPAEQSSLYIRGGMCFACQRRGNEKRRTERKRKSVDGGPVGRNKMMAHDSHRVGQDSPTDTSCPSTGRFKVNGDFIELNPDAIIINGPIVGTRPRGQGYEFDEIGSDVHGIIRGLNAEASSLFSAAGSSTAACAGAGALTVDVHGNVVSSHMNQPHRSEEVDTHYEKTFLSLSRATFLLTQWKASWDESLANGIVAATAAEAAANAAAASVDERALDEAVVAAEAAAALQDGVLAAGEVGDAGSLLMAAADRIESSI